ncbi:MAG: hypothetical protein ABL921_24245, partial [Pirellula sp.]
MKLAFILKGLLVTTLLTIQSTQAADPIAVRAKKVITATGITIDNGIVLCIDGKIKAIGKSNE